MSHAVFPLWLDLLSGGSLVVAAACSAFILVDEIRRPQEMWIMNLVWPLTALFGSMIWLAGYLRWGRGPVRHRTRQSASLRERSGDPGSGGGEKRPQTPMAVAVAKGASHCGAGCTLGDLIAEGITFAFPAVAVAFGWKSLFQDRMFADWAFDYLLAFVLGVAFQYFTIKPMRALSVRDSLVQALKADAASITAWQVGMYGFMAFAQFYGFRIAFGGRAEVNTPEFWLAMQIAMICGFATAYPVNWLLVRSGVKERM